MSKKTLLRGIALALCLSLTGLPGLAEDAVIAPVEAPVQEEAEFALVADQDAASEVPSPSEAEPVPEMEAAPEGEPTPVAEAVPEAEVQPDHLAESAEPEEAPQEVAAPVWTEDVPQEAVAPEPVEAAAQQQTADPGVRAFGETVTVESDAWQGVNLVRAEGFTGPLALVNGQLTLSSVQIDGVPARDADLGAYFTLGPTGSIAVQDDSPLALNVSAFSFNKGSKRTLTLTENGSAVTAKKAKWASSNSKIAKVSRGVVTAKKAGVATITATYNGQTARCLVVATNYKQVKSVKLSKSKLKLALNASIQLGAAIKPGDAHDPTLTWASSAPEIVSVDQNGWIAGLSGGKATITATASNGKSGKCVVTVQEIKPTALSFTQAYVSLNPGEQFAAQVRLSPEAVSNPGVSFATSDAAVATVDASGNITATGYGVATITAASAAVPSLSSTCRVSVREPGSARMAGLIIGINPGHQKTTIKKKYPLAPGSKKTAYGVKTGACGKWTRVNEYETVLQIGLKLAQLLTDEGATVVITRTSNDVMLTNIDRANMLNDAGVDVALQLHCNSVSNSRAEGCSGYIRTTGNWVEESRGIAKSLTQAISAATGCVDLGVKVQNNYMSLNWTTTPSVLLELGYLTNRKEDELLATDAYRQKMAEGIRDGLCMYYGR